jgi:hypothetical protein
MAWQMGAASAFAFATRHKPNSIVDGLRNKGVSEVEIFAPKIGTNKINGLRGAEIRCKDDRSRPFETSPVGYQAFDLNH